MYAWIYDADEKVQRGKGTSKSYQAHKNIAVAIRRMFDRWESTAWDEILHADELIPSWVLRFLVAATIEMAPIIPVPSNNNEPMPS